MFGVIVLAGGAVAAPPAEAGNPWDIAPGEAPAPHWRAQWIWLPASEAADMFLARKAITLPAKPERAVLSITASSRYELFINGTYIGSSPARCAPHH